MEDFIESLKQELDLDVISAPQRFLEEPRGRVKSLPAPLIRPRNVDEVSKTHAYCNANDIAIVPFGGGTGLVGGQIMEGRRPWIILSMERMNHIRFVSEEENAIVAEAGATLEKVKLEAETVGRLFPLSLASQGTSQIGGNLATNAGGVQVLRYGNTRDLCLGIEAVMPDGSIFNGLKTLRKDNTGFDLKNLLIGSEGSLATITAASLKLFPIPKETSTALIAIENPARAIEFFHEISQRFDGQVSGFELIAGQGLSFLEEAKLDVSSPFKEAPKWALLIEVTGLDASARLMEEIQSAMDKSWVRDAFIAQSKAQAHNFWNLRESIPSANRAIGAISSHDISLPISKIPNFIETMQQQLARLGDMRINCFGHLGDGNLHFNLFPAAGKSKEDYMQLRADIYNCVHEFVHEMRGSFSAEHGVGRLKVPDLEKYGDPTKVALMEKIKEAIDPKGIMNPGVIIAEKNQV